MKPKHKVYLFTRTLLEFENLPMYTSKHELGIG